MLRSSMNTTARLVLSTILCFTLLATFMAPASTLASFPIVHSAGTGAIWNSGQRSFSPAAGRDTISQTFSPTSQYYLVEVALSSSDPTDEVFLQLGDNNDDYTQVQSGEDRFFVAGHLQPGVMPALRAIPDPHHDYGGRTLTYEAQVLPAQGLPHSVSGSAVSTVPNLLLFQVVHTATYTVHYHLESGSATLAVYSNVPARQSGKVTGDGGFAVDVPAGLMAVQLKQDPGGSSMRWSLTVGIAPAASGFQPANNATLSSAPGIVSVHTDLGARLVLDHQTIGGTYDRATKRVTYRTQRPLAPGLHLLEVAGADGMPASARSEFLVLPPTIIQPPSKPAGIIDGQAWVRTSTPDGRYGLEKPVTWQIASANGTVVLSDPQGSGFVTLSERYLGTTVNATDIAHKVATALSAKMHYTGTPRFVGNANGAAFAVTISGTKGTTVDLIGMVLPSPQRFSLLLAFGFSDARRPASLKQVATVLESLTAHDEAGVRAARSWLHYQEPGLTLDYPAGWAANFASTDTTWIVGPADQAILFAIGMDFSGSVSSGEAAQVGQQVTSFVKARLHPDLQIVAVRSASGIYRWLGTFTSNGGKSEYVELGIVQSEGDGKRAVNTGIGHEDYFAHHGWKFLSSSPSQHAIKRSST